MNAVWARARGLVFPLVLLGALEWQVGRGPASDALATPSAALLALGAAMRDGSLWPPTFFTLGSAALGLALGALGGR